MKEKNKTYYYSLEQFQRDCQVLAKQIKDSSVKIDSIYGIPSGGVPLAMELSKLLNIPLIGSKEDGVSETTLIVDDIVDSGDTIKGFVEGGYITATLHCKESSKGKPTFYMHNIDNNWIVYWWEGDEEGSIKKIITRQLQFIGENPMREGLIETPVRVVRSWKELYSGYNKNPADILKVFEDGACDEMVLLKNIEFYSMCEHHLLPFFGKAHIAYIPNGKVVGISKLARLLEIFSRRAQIQERLGQQITSTLDELLQPLGSACILEAQHFCMTSRGVQKQNSVMVTSSLTGVFREKAEVRTEFMGLIK